jgi:hypothetical protein
MKPSKAIHQFQVPGRFVYTNAIGRGNVNDTYAAVFRSGAEVHRVILQKINNRVFSHPEWIMANMRIVTDHLKTKVKAENSHSSREWGFPEIIPALDGRDYFEDEEGQFWRAMTMIDCATSYERVRSAEDAVEAGTVLGFFHCMISDLDAGVFYDTLPGFHNCPQYLEKYDLTMKEKGTELCSEGPTYEVQRLIRFIEERRELAGRLERARERGEITTRLIHGDPKVDNIMIDDFTGSGIGIIDLDTVKPGLIHYDFGDAIRSVCNPAGEDASDLKEVIFSLNLCEALVKGYMTHGRKFLTDADRYYLFDAVRLLPFELGLRFFQDYLAGNVYFKVRFEEHNLNRARVQFKLCESIEVNEKAIRQVLEEAGSEG